MRTRFPNLQRITIHDHLRPLRQRNLLPRAKGLVPGNIVVGNSVQSLGFLGGISSSFKTLSGGEITNLTQLITEGRHAAIGRMEKEANDKGPTA